MNAATLSALRVRFADTVFEGAGFRHVVLAGTRRQVMRLDLR